MALSTYEGIVEDRRVRLPDDVKLPEHTRVYVVVPGDAPPARVRVRSPRLAHSEQAPDFAKKVLEASSDAGL